MRIFTQPEAKYYCGGYKNSTGSSQDSIRIFCKQQFGNVSNLREGTTIFDEYRDCALRNIERHLFFAASQYRFSHNLMLAGAAYWAYVTLYYGAFYSARALLGMFGAWIDIPYVITEVKTGGIGVQELTINRKNTTRKFISNYSGPHKKFWDFFYQSIRPLQPWIGDPELQVAITPVNGDPTWLTDNRNEVNYDSSKAINIAKNFLSNYDENQFPDSLPGSLNTQFKITESLMILAFKYAKDFNISTDALNVFAISASRESILQDFIFDSQSELPVSDTKKSRILNCAFGDGS